MAPVTSADRRPNRPLRGMIQPALPLTLEEIELRRAKTRIPVKPESDVGDEDRRASNTSRGDTQVAVGEVLKQDTQNEAVTEMALTKLEDTQATSSTQSDNVIVQVGTNPDNPNETMSVTGDNSVVDSRTNPVSRVDEVDGLARKKTSSATKIPVVEEDVEQSRASSVDGHPLHASSSLRGGIEFDQQRQEGSATSETVSSEQIEPSTTTTTPAQVAGTDSSNLVLAESNVDVPQDTPALTDYDTSQPVQDATRDNHQQTLTNPVSTSAPAARAFNVLPSLTDHLIQINTSGEGADVLIQVNQVNAQPFATYAHSVLLLRSPRLRALIRQQQFSHTYLNNIIALFPARFVIPQAFEAALRFIYSDTVLRKDHFVQPHGGPDYHTVKITNLDYLVSYWVSGIELGLDPVKICAERLLESFLTWDVLESTYKYALELGTSPVVNHSKNAAAADYLVASSSILKLILQFLANHIDVKSFKLDTNPANILVASRLPQLDDGRPKHNPVLASMVFGSMPASAEMSPSSPQSEIQLGSMPTFMDTVASGILLNVDFEHLFTFNTIIRALNTHDDATAKLMVDVVNEREARRQKVHSSRISSKERMANSAAWEAVGVKESLSDTNVLQCDRVGYLAPSTSK